MNPWNKKSLNLDQYLWRIKERNRERKINCAKRQIDKFVISN